jgi:hypothetical protein
LTSTAIITERILLLPAWPQDWEVDFKLHAPKQTTVECGFRAGKVTRLIVSPKERRKEVMDDHLNTGRNQ